MKVHAHIIITFLLLVLLHISSSNKVFYKAGPWNRRTSMLTTDNSPSLTRTLMRVHDPYTVTPLLLFLLRVLFSTDRFTSIFRADDASGTGEKSVPCAAAPNLPYFPREKFSSYTKILCGCHPWYKVMSSGVSNSFIISMWLKCIAVLCFTF